MPTYLSSDQVTAYARDGYLSPLNAFPEEQARQYRDLLEAGERQEGGLSHDRRRKMHLYLKWVNDIARNERILDAVEDILGPDILLFHITCWIKEPQTDAFISWHQDSTYFGLEPAEGHVTAWVALSPSNIESGCVQVAPGTHKEGQIWHGVNKEKGDNLLPVGQSIVIDPEIKIETMPLRPGQFSLHHTHLLHNSMPNQSDDRRIGLGISYIPAHTRFNCTQRVSASLVRGNDNYGHFDLELPPASDFDPAALLRHDEAMQKWNRARKELITRVNGMAA